MPKKKIKPGGSITGRASTIDDTVNKAMRGTPKTPTITDVLRNAMKDPERKENLQVQLNDAGFTTKKNTARQKLRLRKVRRK